MSYPGGKGRALHFLINLMPPHDTYVETHLGGGSLMRSKRPARRNLGIDRDPEVVDAWRDAGPPEVEVHCDDAAAFLRRMDPDAGTLVFCDPPYWPGARRRERCYRYDYSEKQHAELIDVLRSLNCPILLTGYDNTLYSVQLNDWKRMEYINQTQTGPVVECVWMNYEPGEMLHDYRYLGSDFRERERLKRRRQTQIRRLQEADPRERHAVICDIVEAFPLEARAALERAR